MGVKRIESPTLVDFEGDLLTVTATAPLPQGSRVDFVLCLEKQGREQSITGKVTSLVPKNNGRFHIAIRCHCLSRTDRNRILDEING